MAAVFRGSVQVVEADVILPASNTRPPDDKDGPRNPEGIMMASHITDTQPLRESTMDQQQYGTTASNRPNSPGTLDDGSYKSEGAGTSSSSGNMSETNLGFDGSEQSPSPISEIGSPSDSDAGGAVATVIKDAAPKEVQSDVESDVQCGWFGYSPPCVQIFNNAKGYLFFLCMLALIQSMTAFGLVYTTLTTLERRFGLDSFQSSFISSTYEISTLTISLVVTYAGERGHKPMWVGFGSLLFSVGSILYALPHFLTGLYEASDDSRDPLCHLNPVNATDACANQEGGGSGSNVPSVYWIFIIAQLLHGIGGSSISSLGVTYMDENLSSSDFGLYLGIYNASNTAGPALGSIIAGLYLLLYTDFNVVGSGTLTPDSPLWVGAWWLGFLVNGVILFLTSILMLGYPKALPGSDEIAREREDEVQSGQEFESGEGWKERLRGLPRAFLNLITNIPYMCLSLFITCEFFTLATAVFGPKYFESQFNYSSTDAAFYTGILNLIGVMSGALIGGAVVKKFDLKFKGLVRFGILCSVITLGLSFGFWLKCPNAPMAGITVEYYNSSIDLHTDRNITAMCNKDCHCGPDFEPVCGSDDVLYYSSCHAGCLDQSEETLYSNCSCIRNSTDPELGTAREGKCSIFCSSTIPYFFILLLQLLFSGMVIVPTWAATLRCLPFSQRNFGLGLQNIIYSALGTIPGPVVLGLLIDKSCLVWEEFCDGSQVCWLYENSDLAFAFFLVVFVAKIIGFMFIVGALLSYRTSDAKEDDDGTYTKFENENTTENENAT